MPFACSLPLSRLPGINPTKGSDQKQPVAPIDLYFVNRSQEAFSSVFRTCFAKLTVASGVVVITPIRCCILAQPGETRP